MRHLILLAITFVLLPAAASAAPAPQPVSATALATPAFVLTGGGYGHGVGMSQYGAFAQAGAGRTYRDILAFYYRGAEIGQGAAREGARARRERPPVAPDRLDGAVPGA